MPEVDVAILSECLIEGNSRNARVEESYSKRQLNLGLAIFQGLEYDGIELAIFECK
jgi:hypothetical protein